MDKHTHDDAGHCSCKECRPWVDSSLATPPADTTPDATLLAKAEQLYAPELDPSTGDFGGRVWQFAYTCKDLATALRERGEQLERVTRERDAAITKLAENVEQYTTIVSSTFAILTGSWTPDDGCSAVESAALTMRTRAGQAEAQLALCAENTAAADLAQEVECLKSEKEALRVELARVRRDAANAVAAAYNEGREDVKHDYTNSKARRAALAIGGEVVG